MRAGDWYITDDSVEALQATSQLRMEAFNASSAADPARRRERLAELLGAPADDFDVRPPLYVDYGTNLRIGAGTFVNYGLVALDVAPITIGRDCQIASNVQLLTPTHHLDAGPRRARWEAADPIVIGDNVWIGGGAIVVGGVTVGDNAVIGAGALVTSDLPPGWLSVGSPARPVRKLTTD